ncbi:MAG: hypothetical protein CYG59_03710 [Chloroflexi bacterium]|nr:MAG: hypothetical protein CYG59_03710 [Chloroflexota bacterium]
MPHGASAQRHSVIITAHFTQPTCGAFFCAAQAVDRIASGGKGLDGLAALKATQDHGTRHLVAGCGAGWTD